MKKILLATVLSVSLVSPSFAWYDSYGGFTCGYMDPLTSILDSIFGPPCPPPVVVVPAPVVVQQPVPVPVPVPQPVPAGPFMRPCPTYGYWCW